MSKFLTNLSNADDKALQRRAESINTRAKMTFEALINKIKLEIENKNLMLDDLTDLGPDNKNSLRPSASADWNPENWVNEIQNINLEIRELKIQLNEALKAYQKLFVDDDAAKTEIAEG